VRLYLIFTNINCQLNAYTDKLSRIAFQYFFHIHAQFGKILMVLLQIRIYGMVYFDENEEYWGNTTSPIVDGRNRLSVRGVKIFADGKNYTVLN
jgi:hypothetical protein